jgi:biopolymer transport protein ExbD
MAIRFQCPNCNSIRSVHERMSGREIRCPDCEAIVRIPAIQATPLEEAVEPTPNDATNEAKPTVRASQRSAAISVKPKSLTSTSREPIEETPTKVVAFAKKELPKDDMDMTPMVDVTFLLLIFFMITASFTTEKALQQQVSSDQPSAQSKPKEENETLKILIDEFNAYTVIFPDSGESEATSKQELLALLKNAELDGSTEEASSLVIDAHEDSIHAAVVAALDAGRQYKFTNFTVNIVEGFD